MSTQAMAMVKWEIFRPGGGTGGGSAHDYGCDQELLLARVAHGGTLWLVTSRRRGNQPRTYHLAYKLVNCAQIPREQSIFSGRWKYVVRTESPRESRHYGYNDATDTLRRLRFTTGKPMTEVSNMGLRLLSIPELTAEDVALLERLEHKIEHGRGAFISYSHDDIALAETIELELGQRDVSVSRDKAFLLPGQLLAAALEQEVKCTDAFLVLISPSSAQSKPVRDEVRWALLEYEAQGLVKSVIPILLPGGGWEQFPELHRFWRWEYPPPEKRQAEFDRLAKGIVLTRPHPPAPFS